MNLLKMNLETISSNFYLLVRNECSMIISNICSDPLICESYPDIYNLENYLTEKYLPSKVKLLHSQMKKKTKYIISIIIFIVLIGNYHFLRKNRNLKN